MRSTRRCMHLRKRIQEPVVQLPVDMVIDGRRRARLSFMRIRSVLSVRGMANIPVPRSWIISFRIVET